MPRIDAADARAYGSADVRSSRQLRRPKASNLSAYGRLCTEFYDLDKPGTLEEPLAYMRELAEEHGGPVLELMCGSGRYLLPLAQAGFDIDGLDNSPAMLDACRRRLDAAGIEATLHEQSMESMALPRQYRLTIIVDGSICLLTDDHQLDQALRRVRDALLPGGVLALTVLTPRCRSRQDNDVSGRWVRRPDGANILLTTVTRYDSTAAVIRSINRYDLFNGRELLETEFEEFNLRLHERDEFARQLREAGFVQIETHKAHEGGSPSDEDESVFFLCKTPVTD